MQSPTGTLPFDSEHLPFDSSHLFIRQPIMPLSAESSLFSEIVLLPLITATNGIIVHPENRTSVSEIIV